MDETPFKEREGNIFTFLKTNVSNCTLDDYKWYRNEKDAMYIYQIARIFISKLLTSFYFVYSRPLLIKGTKEFE